MTVKEIANMEKTTEQTVRQWIRLKKLNAKLTTKGYEISKKQYDAFVWDCVTGKIQRRNYDVPV